VVTVNVPRAVYECEKDEARFNEIMKERLEMASRALEIKHRALKHHGKGLLPFILQTGNGDQYLRLENCLRVINLAGLKEASEAFCGKSIDDDKTRSFMEQTTRNILTFIHKLGRRRGKRLHAATLPNPEASARLAQLDVERFGVAKTRFSGTRDKPFYSTINRLTISHLKPPQEQMTNRSKPHETLTGGSLSLIDLAETEQKPDELIALTKRLTEEHEAESFTYGRKLTYCVNCKKTWLGLLHKCPSCGAVGTLVFFDRFAGT
jgi:anaerobic ribonucleoside-triphosphate reductase